MNFNKYGLSLHMIVKGRSIRKLTRERLEVAGLKYIEIRHGSWWTREPETEYLIEGSLADYVMFRAQFGEKAQRILPTPQEVVEEAERLDP